MQYIWQHRLWLPPHMATVDGRRVQVLDQGRLNTGAGPDFFNAKVLIDGQMWAGDVEIHVRASDWRRHGHDGDPAYESVVLHVVRHDDAPVLRPDGTPIPQMRMECAVDFSNHYDRLTAAAPAPTLPCREEIHAMESVRLRAWLDRIAFERLQSKAERVTALLERTCGDWESAAYITLARALGFGTNSDPFERLAIATPLNFLGKHSDSVLACEALLFGQAGLIPATPQPGEHLYVESLRREYKFLAHKFSLTPLVSPGWKMARMRPANLPHRRVAFLASMICGGFRLMGALTSITSPDDALKIFDAAISGYWERHCHFGPDEAPQPLRLSLASRRVLAINVAAPLLYAWGQVHGVAERCDMAVELLQALPAESNSIINLFASAGVKCPDAFTSQALVQLRREYCEARKCLFCAIGHRLLSRRAHATTTLQ